MELKDLLTIIILIPGLFLAVAMCLPLKRKKLKAKVLPRILAFGTGVYTFVGSMIFDIFLRPISEFASYTINNIFLSIMLGIMGYIGGRKIARNMPD